MNYPISEINAGIDIDPDDEASDIAAAPRGQKIQKVREPRGTTGKSCVRTKACGWVVQMFDPEAALRGVVRLLDCPVSALEQQIQKVRELRATLESRTQELHELQVAFNQQNKDLIEAKYKAASNCDDEEARLREMTLAEFVRTGNKRPAPGVGIRATKVLRYDEDGIRQWAVSNGYVMFLRLDPGFEAWAKNMIKRKELPAALGELVSEFERPQAIIARDL